MGSGTSIPRRRLPSPSELTVVVGGSGVVLVVETAGGGAGVEPLDAAGGTEKEPGEGAGRASAAGA
jgi:hypothetical protein